MAAIKKAWGRKPKPPEAGPRNKDQANCTDGESRVMVSSEGLLAGTGYYRTDNVRRCEAEQIILYISGHRERHNLAWDERFKLPPTCPPDDNTVTMMAHRLRTAEGKVIYTRRKYTVEKVFGIVMGFRRFPLRGLVAA